MSTLPNMASSASQHSQKVGSASSSPSASSASSSSSSSSSSSTNSSQQEMVSAIRSSFVASLHGESHGTSHVHMFATPGGWCAHGSSATSSPRL